MKTRIFLIAVFAAIMALLHASPLGQRLERVWGLPALYTLRGPVEVPQEALIIALDQRSIEWLGFHADDYGRVSDLLPGCLPAEAGPLLEDARNINDTPRQVHKCLIRLLAERGAPVIAFDILFQAERDGDALFAEVIADAGTVILFERIRSEEELPDALSGPVILQRAHPREIFVSAAAGTASFVVNAPMGGFVEGYFEALDEFPDLPAMPEAVHALYAGQPQPVPDPGRMGAQRPIWLYGPPRAIRTLSLIDVFDRGRAMLPDDLSTTAVFVGLSDPDIMNSADHFPVPISDALQNDIGGVELAASAFLNLLHGHRLTGLAPLQGAGITGLLALAMAAAAFGSRGRAGMIGAGAIGLGWAAAAAVLFASQQIWLPFAVPLMIALPAVMVVGLASRYALVRTLAERLAPRPVVDVMLDRASGTGGVKTEPATILFTDIMGSTTMGDRMDPEAYTSVISGYYERAGVAVEAERGMVVEFLGDGILAVFSQSVAGHDHAARGCRAAIALSRTIREVGREKGDDPKLSEVRLRMGISTGLTATGGIGSKDRFNFKALGDTVNTAARLEQLGKAVDDRTGDVILMSGDTWEAAGLPPDSCEPLGEYTLRGKRDPVRVYRLRLAPSAVDNN